MGWRLRLLDKTVWKFVELPIHCQRQKCNSGNVVSGSIRFMQIFAGVRWRGGVNWECGRWKWRFSLLSFTVFRTFYIYTATRPLSRDATVDDLGDISRSLDCFTSNFSRTMRNTAKVTIDYANGKSYTIFLLVPLLMTLNDIWRSFHLTTPIYRKLYMIRPQKLKLLIRNLTSAFRWYECRWTWRYFKVIKLFHIKFLGNGAL